MLFDFMTFEEFVKWYTELGKLKIFWAKPVKNISLLSEEDSLYLVGIKWIVRSRINASRFHGDLLTRYTIGEETLKLILEDKARPVKGVSSLTSFAVLSLLNHSTPRVDFEH